MTMRRKKILKLLSKFLKFLNPEPERSESWEEYIAKMRAPYLANLEQRFGTEFVAKVRENVHENVV